MNSNKIIKVKHANKLPAELKPLSQPTQQAESEQPQTRQPELFEPVVLLESLVEPTRDESVYGSGWSLAQLMNEFGGR